MSEKTNLSEKTGLATVFWSERDVEGRTVVALHVHMGDPKAFTVLYGENADRFLKDARRLAP